MENLIAREIFQVVYSNGLPCEYRSDEWNCSRQSIVGRKGIYGRVLPRILEERRATSRRNERFNVDVDEKENEWSEVIRRDRR